MIDLRKTLSEEKRQTTKLGGMIKTGQDALKVEQDRVQHLEEQLKAKSEVSIHAINMKNCEF